MADLWLHLTSGQGPDECAWVVAKLLEVIEEELQESGLVTHKLEAIRGEKKGTLLSVLLAVEGDEASLQQAVQTWQGTIQWIGPSPFRPHHKRKNWFVGVEPLLPPAATEWNHKELRVEVMRASGAGGQHVNKTESAVRITHTPTGLAAIAREERSQQRNRKLALARLAQLLAKQTQDAQESAKQERWSQHHQLERGNPTRTFTGDPLREKT